MIGINRKQKQYVLMWRLKHYDTKILLRNPCGDSLRRALV
jgi:hypothetical protein